MVLRCALCIAVIFFAVSAFSGAHAAEWFVDASVSGPGDGTAPERAFETIQKGIHAAADGLSVVVA